MVGLVERVEQALQNNPIGFTTPDDATPESFSDEEPSNSDEDPVQQIPQPKTNKIWSKPLKKKLKGAQLEARTGLLANIEEIFNKTFGQNATQNTTLNAPSLEDPYDIYHEFMYKNESMVLVQQNEIFFIFQEDKNINTIYWESTAIDYYFDLEDQYSKKSKWIIFFKYLANIIKSAIKSSSYAQNIYLGSKLWDISTGYSTGNFGSNPSTTEAAENAPTTNTISPTEYIPNAVLLGANAVTQPWQSTLIDVADTAYNIHLDHGIDPYMNQNTMMYELGRQFGREFIGSHISVPDSQQMFRNFFHNGGYSKITNYYKFQQAMNLLLEEVSNGEPSNQETNNNQDNQDNQETNDSQEQSNNRDNQDNQETNNSQETNNNEETSNSQEPIRLIDGVILLLKQMETISDINDIDPMDFKTLLDRLKTTNYQHYNRFIETPLGRILSDAAKTQSILENARYPLTKIDTGDFFVDSLMSESSDDNQFMLPILSRYLSPETIQAILSKTTIIPLMEDPKPLIKMGKSLSQTFNTIRKLHVNKFKFARQCLSRDDKDTTYDTKQSYSWSKFLENHTEPIKEDPPYSTDGQQGLIQTINLAEGAGLASNLLHNFKIIEGMDETQQGPFLEVFEQQLGMVDTYVKRSDHRTERYRIFIGKTVCRNAKNYKNEFVNKYTALRTRYMDGTFDIQLIESWKNNLENNFVVNEITEKLEKKKKDSIAFGSKTWDEIKDIVTNFKEALQNYAEGNYEQNIDLIMQYKDAIKNNMPEYTADPKKKLKSDLEKFYEALDRVPTPQVKKLLEKMEEYFKNPTKELETEINNLLVQLPRRGIDESLLEFTEWNKATKTEIYIENLIKFKEIFKYGFGLGTVYYAGSLIHLFWLILRDQLSKRVIDIYVFDTALTSLLKHTQIPFHILSGIGTDNALSGIKNIAKYVFPNK